MRVRLVFTTLVSVSLSLFPVALADPSPEGGSSLYPPGLLPIINRADALLSVGQFNDAAKAYSEAIGWSISLAIASIAICSVLT